jgi:glutamyl-tRNA synthetase
MTVVTRFAPSPTGFLHIGGARTALFNWLYARHHKGKFLLRIEDTDRERSTQAAIDAIIDGMQWLGLDCDGEPIFQFARAARHAEVAHELVAQGKAYHCYTSAEELAEQRAAAQAKGEVFKYDRKWRDMKASDAPAGVKPSVRIKAPLEGSITVHDKVQGEVTVDCKQLDDMVLLRSDGTPTYMLAVVVDDYDMGVTQVIRGDDHLTNTFRQLMIYNAMGWKAPDFAHIPLIHGADGAKLSKRHGALGVDAYRDMGYLPEAVRNYLLRLGWSHGDDEIISTEQAIEWFGLEAVGKSPSRFDFTKLENLNGHYMREADDARLTDLISPKLGKVDDAGRARLIKGMNGLKQRAKNLNELAESAAFYVAARPLDMDAKAADILKGGGSDIIRAVLPLLEAQENWDHKGLEQTCREYAEGAGQKLGSIAQPLRAALSGKTVSPGVFEVMEILGKNETLGRLADVC